MDEERHDVDQAEAARALAAISDTRQVVAGRVGSPPGYYLKLGVGTAIITASQPFENSVQTPATLAGVAVVLWAVHSYSKATGTWTMATLREKGAWMAWLMITVMVASMFAAMWSENLTVSLVGAAAILLVVPTLGPRWDAAWVRSLKARA